MTDTIPGQTPPHSSPLPTPSLGALTRAFFRIGCISFGGPAGQIALMHREIVDERKWIDEADYLRALNFCHFLPGPEAQQLATYIGWRLHGVAGGLIAGGLFVIPGALVMLALSLLYALAANLGWFAALMLGLKAAVLALVAQALLRIAGRALDTTAKRVIALAAFLALFLFNAPFPAVLFVMAASGAILANAAPRWLALKPPAPSSSAPLAGHVRHSLLSLAIGLALWAIPFVLILLTLGQSHVLFAIAAFFSKLAVVTFGGAYAVLSYMAQQAVQVQGWLSARQMADGLGLAETTPGPLILVTQFVGFLGAWHAPAPFTPLVAGLLGAAVTLWVTFVPCFLWIFTLAPWLEATERANWLRGALAAMSAAVVGVIANLTVWFALHILFRRVGIWEVGPARIQLPAWDTLDWRIAVIAAFAALLLFRLRWGVLRVLGLAMLAGLALAATGPLS